MIIRHEQEININGLHKVIVSCDNKLCKQPINYLTTY